MGLDRFEASLGSTTIGNIEPHQRALVQSELSNLKLPELVSDAIFSGRGAGDMPRLSNDYADNEGFKQ